VKQEREGLVVGGLVAFALALWLGFLVHRSPRFPGSGWGLAFGTAAAALMFVPLLYSAAKRLKPIRSWITRRVPMRTWLAVHIYAGIMAPILALVHTGHRFVSPIGIALTAMMLIVMLSGFAGRYLLRYASGELREKAAMLAKLRAAYDEEAVALAARRAVVPMKGARWAPLRWVTSRVLVDVDAPVGDSGDGVTAARASNLTESIADVEYGVRSQEWFQRAFGLWLKLHGVLAAFLFALLAVHVWIELRLGLRWWT
jgi:hypothetical protein